MTVHILMPFSGAIQDAELKVYSDQPPLNINALNEERFLLGKKISEKLKKKLPEAEVNVTIQFRKGSVFWEGVVDIVQHSWPAVQAMATIVEMTRSVVNGVLSNHFSKALNASLHEEPMTSITISHLSDTSGISTSQPYSIQQIVHPNANPAPLQNNQNSNLLHIAALICSGALFIGSIALVVMAAQ